MENIQNLIPTLSQVESMPKAAFVDHDARLERIVGRLLTATEKSAAEAMATEHASYGSTRWYLQTLLPVDGPNHFAGIGHEAAVVLMYVSPITGKSVVVAYSSESHNWPSYVAPHPGAATGTGGDERDKIVKTGNKPETVSEARRQAHPVWNPHNDPVQRHTDETTKGIADYANAMGIPHGTGSIKFHTNYSGNNLVNVAGVSITTKDRLQGNKVPIHDAPDRYVAIYVGKASDRTGIGGTKGASKAIDMTLSDLNESAVQDPDPHLQEADVRGIEMIVDIAIAEGWNHQISYKDMGAAGLLCSTVEQLHRGIGLTINGDLVPQNEPRTASELLEAETQERFMIFVHENYAQRILDILNKEIGLPTINRGARAAIIGKCNDSGRYVFVRSGIVEVDLPAEDLKAGPLLPRKIIEPESRAQPLPPHPPLQDQILAVLNAMSFKSDAYVFDHYDQHVRSTNIVTRGRAAAPLRTHELFEGKVGFSEIFDSNTVYGLLDPKFQAEDSLIRAAYKLAAVGCSIVGVSNNANYGRMDVPEEMWQFKEGQEGIARACRNWQLEPQYLEMISRDAEIKTKLGNDQRRHVTVNSGNCSVNKANANTGTAIPPTTILETIGWTNAPQQYATWDLKPVPSTLYLVGDRQQALGGTEYLQAVHGPDAVGDNLFHIDYPTANSEVQMLVNAVRGGYVQAANVIEEGGLCNAIAEMVANTEVPIDVDVDLDAPMSTSWSTNIWLTYTQKLFSENYGMIVQILPEHLQAFRTLAERAGVSVHRIGTIEPVDTTKPVDATGHLRFVMPTSRKTCTITSESLSANYRSKMENLLDGRSPVALDMRIT